MKQINEIFTKSNVCIQEITTIHHQQWNFGKTYQLLKKYLLSTSTNLNVLCVHMGKDVAHETKLGEYTQVGTRLV